MVGNVNAETTREVDIADSFNPTIKNSLFP